MLKSLEICKQRIKSSILRSEIKDVVEVGRDNTLQDFINQSKSGKAYLVGWRGPQSTWATVLIIGNDRSFLVTRNPLPENTLKGRAILKGKYLTKTFGEVENELLCLETD